MLVLDDLGHGEAVGECAWRREGQEVPQGDVASGGALDQCGEAQRGERVASGVEEVGVRARRELECGRPRVDEAGFEFAVDGRGRAVVGRAGGDHLPPHRGERVPVGLAVGRERDVLDGVHRRGLHERRQRRTRLFAHRPAELLVGSDGVGRGPDERGQAAVRAAAHGGGDDAGHIGGGGQHRFDLTELEAGAADLHLVVASTVVLEHTAGQPSAQVTGVVETLAGSERMWDEAFLGQVGASVVAEREPDARHVDASDDALGQQATLLVEHVDLLVTDRTADRERRRADDLTSVVCGGVEGDLAHAVEVERRHVRHRRTQGVDQFAGHALAAQRDGLDVGEAFRQIGDAVDHRLDERGRQDQPADPMLSGEFDEGAPVGTDLLGDEHHRRTAEQRAPQLPQVIHEVERHLLQHALVLTERVRSPLPAAATEHAAVVPHDALGDAGRARGVGDVQRIVGESFREFRSGRRTVCGEVPEEELGDRRRLVVGQSAHRARCGLVDHDVSDARVARDQLEASRRVRRVHGHVHSAGEHDAEQGDDGLVGPSHRDADRVAGSDAGSDETCGDCACGLVQLADRALCLGGAVVVGLDGGDAVGSRRHDAPPLGGEGCRRLFDGGVVPLDDQLMVLGLRQ